MLIWCGFLGGVNAITVLSGLMVVFAVSLFFGLSTQRINPIFFTTLLLRVFYQLIESSYFVVVEIFSKTDVRKYEVKTLSVTRLSKTQQVLLAGLISLTPGTLTIDISERQVTIHDMFAHKSFQIEKEIAKKLVPLIQKAFPA